ncbi:DUF2461 domain-containing protein [Agarilytica rhodophyticola]|uniref:DUF2461 domain-containing protein n=1 Tax=Agarilytica rhodophyticola TaxID=1737490 RepID=UPI000B345F2C|nr:DUF2461 domain-containing protein [Agarilytica rhodophyticola]
MSTAKFKHFDPSLFRFLEELRYNNNKEWFTENKPRYKTDVVAPMLDFIVAISGPLADISPHFLAIPKAHGGSLFRIYKDARFSKDDTPYKEHTACRFLHSAAKDVHTPAFYVHLGIEEVIYGGGIWAPDSETLYAIRDRIREKPQEWQKVCNDKQLVKIFGGISGEGLKRPPRGFDADLPFIEDIKRKSFFAMKTSTPEMAMSKTWMNEVKKTFTAVSPLLSFICKAIDRPF